MNIIGFWVAAITKIFITILTGTTRFFITGDIIHYMYLEFGTHHRIRTCIFFVRSEGLCPVKLSGHRIREQFHTVWYRPNFAELLSDEYTNIPIYVFFSPCILTGFEPAHLKGTDRRPVRLPISPQHTILNLISGYLY